MLSFDLLNGAMIPRQQVRSLLAISLCLILFLACHSSSAAEPKRVLLLDSFGRDFAPWNEFTKRLRTELAQHSPGEDIDLYEEALSSARFGSQPEKAFADYLLALFSDRQVDLVVSVGSPAAAFVQQYRHQLFPSVPMLLTAVEERRVSLVKLTCNDTTVSVSIDFMALLDNILRVLPDTTKIVTIIGDSPIEKYWVEQLKHAFEPLHNRLTFAWFNELSFDDMLKRVGMLPPRSAIIFGMLDVDAAGVPHDESAALTRLSATANAPTFTYVDSYLGRGIVGGPMLSMEELSRQAAHVAFRLLRGEPAGNIKAAPIGFALPKFDWREMQRWSIRPSDLPPGSKIYFRDPSGWEQYRWQIITIAALVLVQTSLIAGLFYERHRRRYAEALSRQRMYELAHMNRSATAGELSSTIAHEVKQPLAAIAVNGRAALRWLTKGTPGLGEARAALERIVDSAHRASDVIDTIRSMVRKSDGQRIALDANMLIKEVLALLRGELERRGILVEARLQAGLPEIVGNRVQLQQVILNLIINAAEAMDSTTALGRVLRVMSEGEEPSSMRITVEDSGPGIELENIDRIFQPFYTTKPEGMGMGLAICRSIVEAHGGRLLATPGRPCGLALHIFLPVVAIGRAPA